MDAQILLEKLEKVRSTGKDKWVACCPAHDDKSPSLQITQANDRILIHCFAGCGGNEVLESVGLDFSILYPEDKDYSTRPRYKKPVLEEKYFIEIYKNTIRRGETPIDSDTARYKQIVSKIYTGLSTN